MPERSPHPLLDVLVACVGGDFPPVDGRVEVLPPDPRGRWAIAEFTGHAFVLCERTPGDDVFDGVDAFGRMTHPSFVLDLAPAGAAIGSHDVVLVRRAAIGEADPLPPTGRHDDHPRVTRARRHRDDVHVCGDERGVVTIGRGLVGRIEMSVELVAERAAPGAGRSLISGGLATLPEDEVVFAQVAPGNAASLRAFLACGFTPIGSEILIEPS